MDELKRRRMIQTGDIVVFDRGYYSYDNYVNGVRDYRIVPIIFPKKKFDINKVMRKMNYPLNIFSSHEYRKIQEMYQNLVHKMVDLIDRWHEFPALRSLIEDIFKLAKDTFSLRDLHRYSAVYVKKFVAINVILLGVAMRAGNNEKKLIQRMSEW